MLTNLQTEGQIQNAKLLDVEIDTDGSFVVVTEDVVIEAIDQTGLADGDIAYHNA